MESSTPSFAQGNGSTMNLFEATAAAAPDLMDVDRGLLHTVSLGITVYNDGLKADNLLASCAADLASFGYRLGGVVQANPQRPGRRKCDMYLKDLLSGEEILISSDRGNAARGCRLDLAAFVRICASGERALAENVDLLVLNKFGKEEVRGRGFRPLIAEALIAEIPVLTAVSRQNLADFLAFAGGSSTRLPSDRGAIVAWCRKAINRRAGHERDGR
jgi:nucleoside-triphosphatase THEP1